MSSLVVVLADVVNYFDSYFFSSLSVLGLKNLSEASSTNLLDGVIGLREFLDHGPADIGLLEAAVSRRDLGDTLGYWTDLAGLLGVSDVTGIQMDAVV